MALRSPPCAGDGRLPGEQAEEVHTAAQVRSTTGCLSISHPAQLNQKFAHSCWCLHLVPHHTTAQAAANARLQKATDLVLTCCSSHTGTALSKCSALRFRKAANCLSFPEQGIAAAQCRCCALHSRARCRCPGLRHAGLPAGAAHHTCNTSSTGGGSSTWQAAGLPDDAHQLAH